jgi:hypothetical protein
LFVFVMAESGKQLHAAAKEGRLEDLGALLKQVEVNWADEDKDCMTALIHAARNGHGKAVDFLLGQGAAIDRPDRIGNMALLHAMAKSQAQVVQKLVAAGASIDKRNKQGHNAVDIASQNGLNVSFALLGQKRTHSVVAAASYDAAAVLKLPVGVTGEVTSTSNAMASSSSATAAVAATVGMSTSAPSSKKEEKAHGKPAEAKGSSHGYAAGAVEFTVDMFGPEMVQLMHMLQNQHGSDLMRFLAQNGGTEALLEGCGAIEGVQNPVLAGVVHALERSVWAERECPTVERYFMSRFHGLVFVCARTGM